MSARGELRHLQLFNVSIFSQLLGLLLYEVRQMDKYQTPGQSSLHEPSPIMRRILPLLRLYSGWLLSEAKLLLANEDLGTQLQQLFQAYAEALSLLVNHYPTANMPNVPYLLDEDSDTLGFTPFSEALRNVRFRDEQSQTKPTFNEVIHGPRVVEKEMLYRIKCLIVDGVLLCKRPVSNLAPCCDTLL
jgi:hypothetical protein